MGWGGGRSAGKNCYLQYSKKTTIFEYNRLKIVHKILLFFEYLKTRGKGGRGVDLN